MLERTKYGIEYNPRQQPEGSSGLGWIVSIAVLSTLVSLGISLGKRLTAKVIEEPDEIAVAVTDSPSPPPVAVSSAAGAADRPAVTNPPSPVAVKPPEKIVTSTVNRPQVVKNLLMRLDEANRRRDIQMQITTIEQLRQQPGAADLDDMLARQLGALNVRKLFTLKSREWVEQVEVKRGDSASRIASEHGSTFASFAELNGGKVDRIRIGEKLYVMARPKFSLTVHRRVKYADLLLNGKFFKRYDLHGEIKKANGAYDWGTVGGSLPLKNHLELNMLLPRSTVTVISEL